MALVSSFSIANSKIYHPERDCLGFKIEEPVCESGAPILESSLILRGEASYKGPKWIKLTGMYQVAQSTDGKLVYYINGNEEGSNNRREIYFQGYPLLESWDRAGENFTDSFDNIAQNLLNNSLIQSEGLPIFYNLEDLLWQSINSANEIRDEVDNTVSPIIDDGAEILKKKAPIFKDIIKSINDIPSILYAIQSSENELSETISSLENLIYTKGIPSALYLTAYISEKISPLIKTAQEIWNNQITPTAENISNEFKDQNFSTIINIDSYKDIVISGTGMTLGSLIDAIKFIDNHSTTEISKNHFKKYIFIPVSAYADCSIISSIDFQTCDGVLQYDNIYEYSSGLSGFLSAKTEARWDTDGSIGDFIKKISIEQYDIEQYLNQLPQNLIDKLYNITLWKADMDLSIEFGSTTTNSGKEAYSFIYNDYSFGYIKSSKIIKKRKNLIATRAEFSPSSGTISGEYLKESLEETTESSHKKLYFGINNPTPWGNLAWITTLDIHDYDYELIDELSGTKYTLSMENGFQQDKAQDKKKKENWTKYSMEYGLAGSFNLNDHLTIFANINNNGRTLDRTVGAIFSMKYLTLVGTDKSANAMLTLFDLSNGQNDTEIKKNIIDQNTLSINPIGDELQIQRTQLRNRNLNGLFLFANYYNNSTHNNNYDKDQSITINPLFALNDSYIGIGTTLKQDEIEYFVNTKFKNFALQGSHAWFDNGINHGETITCDIQWLLKDIAIGMRIQQSGVFYEQNESMYVTASGNWPLKLMHSIFDIKK